MKTATLHEKTATQQRVKNKVEERRGKVSCINNKDGANE